MLWDGMGHKDYFNFGMGWDDLKTDRYGMGWYIILFRGMGWDWDEKMGNRSCLVCVCGWLGVCVCGSRNKYQDDDDDEYNKIDLDQSINETNETKYVVLTLTHNDVRPPLECLSQFKAF